MKNTRILYLPNWKVKRTKEIPSDLRYGDYITPKVKYGIFRYFQSDVQVDVIDTTTFPMLEKFEKNVLRFYVIQGIKAIIHMHEYDFIISDGAQSAMVIALWRRFIKTRNIKHILIDVGSFNSGSEKGIKTKLLQFASKSIDGVLYHMPAQVDFYKKVYPWLINRLHFSPCCINTDFFDSYRSYPELMPELPSRFILCVGYKRRDRATLIQAYEKLREKDLKLVMVGKDISYGNKNIICIPQVSTNVLNDIIKRAEICVLPLEDYNFSYGQLTLLQQMYLEKPIITARVNSLEYYTNEGVNCLLYTPLDAEDLKNKIQMLIDNNDMKIRIAKAARETVINQFSARVEAQDLENYLEQFV